MTRWHYLQPFVQNQAEVAAWGDGVQRVTVVSGDAVSRARLAWRSGPALGRGVVDGLVQHAVQLGGGPATSAQSLQDDDGEEEDSEQDAGPPVGEERGLGSGNHEERDTQGEQEDDENDLEDQESVGGTG